MFELVEYGLRAGSHGPRTAECKRKLLCFTSTIRKKLDEKASLRSAEVFGSFLPEQKGTLLYSFQRIDMITYKIVSSLFLILI